MSDTAETDAEQDTGPSVAERLDHALRLLAASRAREAATGPQIREAMMRVADERERAVRAELEVARLTALLAEARQDLADAEREIANHAITIDRAGALWREERAARQAAEAENDAAPTGLEFRGG